VRKVNNKTQTQLKMVTTRNLTLLALAACFQNILAANVCVVPGGTADDTPAIKAALTTCNNGGTVRANHCHIIFCRIFIV